MPLGRRFIEARIEKIANSFVLTVTYNYYFLWDFNETFVFSERSAAVGKLLQLRCGNDLLIDESGE
jgi:hypothetical protein